MSAGGGGWFEGGGRTWHSDRLDAARVHAFVERFAHVAATEQKKFGIPAAIILANGLYHSQGGTSALVVRGNNYFALPCTARWGGATLELGGRCYRRYDNAWLSFRDHSLWLADWSVGLSASDLAGWAALLERQVYGEPGLAARLLELIRTWGLDR